MPSTPSSIISSKNARTLSSGGRGPVAAVTKNLGGSGYSELIVANQSGTIAPQSSGTMLSARRFPA